MIRNRPSEEGSVSLLTFLVGMPVVLFLIVGFLFPLTVRAAVQKPIDALVDGYVDAYASYGTLTVSEVGASTTVRLDELLKAELLAQTTVSGDDLVVSCGTVGVNSGGVARLVPTVIQAGKPLEVPVGSIVGCSVSGTIFSWPSVGPFMEAAPFLFGGDYSYLSVAYVDQGDDPLYQ